MNNHSSHCWCVSNHKQGSKSSWRQSLKDFVCMHLKIQSKQMSHVNKPPRVYLISVLQLKLHNVTIIFSWRYQVDSQEESHTDFSKTRYKTSSQDIFSPNPLKIPFPLVPTFSRDMTSSTEWKVLKEIVWSWWKYGLNKKWISLDFEIFAALILLSRRNSRNNMGKYQNLGGNLGLFSVFWNNHIVYGGNDWGVFTFCNALLHQKRTSTKHINSLYFIICSSRHAIVYNGRIFLSIWFDIGFENQI